MIYILCVVHQISLFPKQLSTDIAFDYVNVDFVAYNELDSSLPVVVMGWGATFVSLYEVEAKCNHLR